MSSAQHMPSPMAPYAAPPGEVGLFYDPVLRLGISWLDKPARIEPFTPAETSPGLVEAVAGIVAIAASRARDAGELLALRHAVESALGLPFASPTPTAQDPRENGMVELPSITDAQNAREADRLAALMRRQSAG